MDIHAKDPFDYLLPHIVSIGKKDETPCGSGTLIKFSIILNQAPVVVYTILTATHVLEELGLLNFVKDGVNEVKHVVISKPIDRLGNVRGVLWKV